MRVDRHTSHENKNVRRSLITRTPVSGARDTHGVIFVIGSSELTGEPLTRTPVSGARDTHGVIFVRIHRCARHTW